MGLVALCGADVFDGDTIRSDQAVLIDGITIADVLPMTALSGDVPVHDLRGGLLAPGFIDAQVNGGGGVLFNDSRTRAGVDAIAKSHGRLGTTGLLPTFITDRPERRREAVGAIRDAIAANTPGVLGLHLEGPFLALARKGAHDSALIVPMTDQDVDELCVTGLETLILTVAAEAASPAQIRRLTAAGVIVSLGHSDASGAAAQAATDAGARCVTHLFNAMSQLGHRAPGLVGTALDRGDLWGGIIADGHHVDPAVLRIALRAKRGPARLFLVSDAMPPAGSSDDTFMLSGRVATRRGGALTFDDGTLAGADLTMVAAVRFAIGRLEQPLAEALRMASLYPAQCLRLDDRRGRIGPGYTADLVLLDADLAVRHVWIGGRSVHPESG